jgi:hypothetical protein
MNYTHARSSINVQCTSNTEGELCKSRAGF